MERLFKLFKVLVDAALKLGIAKMSSELDVLKLFKNTCWCCIKLLIDNVEFADKLFKLNNLNSLSTNSTLSIRNLNSTSTTVFNKLIVYQQIQHNQSKFN